MQSELLKLHAAKIMNVGGVSFHFLQLKVHLGLGEHVLFVRSDDSRLLPELARATAPARPDAQAQIIDRQARRGHDVQNADQGLHAVEFAPDIFAEHAALQVGQNHFGHLHRQSI